MLGIAAGLGALKVCLIALKPMKKTEARVFGKILERSNHPQIWDFVETINKKVGGSIPDQIILGMEPNFFVTEAKVICLDGEFKGKTLFISLPFCRVLTKNELAAIVGHEMGHFIGRDTKWSRRFYPIYRGSIETIHTLQYTISNHGLVQLAFLPAIFFMSIFIHAFEKTEKKISRERELNADKVGISVSSANSMATSLLKTHIYQQVWIFTNNKMKEALENGKQIVNVANYFQSICDSIPHDFMKDEIGKSSTTHPTDSHPPLTVRLNAIGVQLSDIYPLQQQTEEKAIELIDNAEIHEQGLSDLEHQKLIRTGQVKIPEPAPENTPA